MNERDEIYSQSYSLEQVVTLCANAWDEGWHSGVNNVNNPQRQDPAPNPFRNARGRALTDRWAIDAAHHLTVAYFGGCRVRAAAFFDALAHKGES